MPRPLIVPTKAVVAAFLGGSPCFPPPAPKGGAPTTRGRGPPWPRRRRFSLMLEPSPVRCVCRPTPAVGGAGRHTPRPRFPLVGAAASF